MLISASFVGCIEEVRNLSNDGITDDSDIEDDEYNNDTAERKMVLNIFLKRI